MTLAIEAYEAKYFGEGTPFGRPEFDKWFADYDVGSPIPLSPRPCVRPPAFGRLQAGRAHAGSLADNGRAGQALCDVSGFFAPELVAAYPDAKFVLTHREPQAWLRSIHKTFVPLQKAQHMFPLWPMRVLEPFTRTFFRLTALISRVLWSDVGVYEGDEADKVLLQTYTAQ
jgi:hypothetical protein